MENDLVQDNPDRVIRRMYGDKRIITVLLGAHTPRVRKQFHCINCGKRLFDYYSEVAIILEGEMREVARPIDLMCRSNNGCKTIYRIA